MDGIDSTRQPEVVELSLDYHDPVELYPAYVELTALQLIDVSSDPELEAILQSCEIADYQAAEKIAETFLSSLGESEHPQASNARFFMFGASDPDQNRELADHFMKCHGISDKQNLLAYLWIHQFEWLRDQTYSLSLKSALKSEYCKKYVPFAEKITTDARTGISAFVSKNAIPEARNLVNEREDAAIRTHVASRTTREDLSVLRPSAIAEDIEPFLKRYPCSQLIFVDPLFTDANELKRLRNEISGFDPGYSETAHQDGTIEFKFLYSQREITFSVIPKKITSENVKDFPSANIYEQGGVIEGTLDVEFLEAMANYLVQPAFIVDKGENAGNRSYRDLCKKTGSRIFGIPQTISLADVDGFQSELKAAYHVIIDVKK